MSCLFCRIIAGEIPSSKVFEDADLFAFNDIKPQAPLHVLIVPRKHIATTNDLTIQDEALVGKVVPAAAAIATEKGCDQRGYRTVLNCNSGGGETVFPPPLPLLAGRHLGWPPG